MFWELKPISFQVALCSAYIRIAKICSPHIWRPESLVSTLSLLEPCFPLIVCFQVALSILGPDLIGGQVTNDGSVGQLTVGVLQVENVRVGEKRPIEDVDAFKKKRQKVDEVMGYVEQKRTRIVTCERDEDYATNMRVSLLSFVEFLKPPAVKPDTLRPDLALGALSMLCIAFCRYPNTNLWLRIFQQMFSWMPWIVEQVF